MKWLSDSIERLKEATRAEPVVCPRGWGNVSFVVEVSAFWPFFSFERRCPISGSERCASCSYPCNPDQIDALRAALVDLQQLHHEGVLTEDEYQIRRASIVRFQDLMESGSRQRRAAGFRTAAWTLGPLSALFLAAGPWLASTFHQGFWGVAGLGAVMLALTVSFAALAMPRATPDSASESP